MRPSNSCPLCCRGIVVAGAVCHCQCLMLQFACLMYLHPDVIRKGPFVFVFLELLRWRRSSMLPLNMFRNHIVLLVLLLPLDGSVFSRLLRIRTLAAWFRTNLKHHSSNCILEIDPGYSLVDNIHIQTG